MNESSKNNLKKEEVKNLILSVTHDLKNVINILSSGYSYINSYLISIDNLEELRNELCSLTKDMNTSFKLLNIYINNIEIFAMLLDDKNSIFVEESFVLGNLCENINGELSSYFNEYNVTVEYSYPECIIIFNKMLLKSIIVNVLLTSLRYTPMGGTIRCEFNRVNDKRLDILVKDNGKGIPNKSPEYIFTLEAHSKAKELELRYGRALGLGLVGEIVKKVNGDIRITKEKDITITEISLPIRSEK